MDFTNPAQGVMRLDLNPVLNVVRLPGDLNGDGDVGPADLDLLLGHWGQSVAAGLGNLDGRGVVDDFDLNVLLSNWIGPLAVQGVPEPAGMALLGLWALVLTPGRFSTRRLASYHSAHYGKDS